MISSPDQKRALHMYELASKLVEAKGALVPIGLGTVMEYRVGNVTIHYLPKSGHLDVWYRRKVLTIDRWGGDLHVTRYTPGEDWEEELEKAVAAKPPPKR